VCVRKCAVVRVWQSLLSCWGRGAGAQRIIYLFTTHVFHSGLNIFIFITSRLFFVFKITCNPPDSWIKITYMYICTVLIWLPFIPLFCLNTHTLSGTPAHSAHYSLTHSLTHSSLITHHSSLITHHSSLITHHCLLSSLYHTLTHSLSSLHHGTGTI
jgi:hypothetical protein